MSRRVAASVRCFAWLAITVASCHPGDIGGTGATCDSERPCRAYYACVRGRCQIAPAPPDGSTDVPKVADASDGTTRERDGDVDVQIDDSSTDVPKVADASDGTPGEHGGDVDAEVDHRSTDVPEVEDGSDATLSERDGDVDAEIDDRSTDVPKVEDSVGTPLISVNDSSGSWDCTGTMITARWMLTAQHCVTKGNVLTGGTVVDSGSVGAILNGGSNIAHDIQIVRHPALDAALVLLDQMPLNSSGQSFHNRPYRGATSALVSHSFYTQGWRNNQTTQCSPGLGGTGSRTLRSTTLAIQSMIDSAHFNITPNGSGLIEWTGDSGSSLFSVVAGLNRPNGVESTVNCTSNSLAVTAIQHVRGDAIRSWVEGITGTSPAIGSQAGFERSDDGTSSVVYRDPTNHVHELCLGGQCGSSWHVGDLVIDSGAPNVASNLSANIRADTTSVVVYRTASNHIQEIGFYASGWMSGDLTVIAGAVTAAGDPAAYTRSDQTTAVVYRGSDNRIYELELDPGSSQWQENDLTSDSGAPLAGGDPVGYVRADATNAVVFVSANDGHVRELSLPAGAVNWAADDLTALASAPTVGGAVRPYTRSDGWSVVVFRGTDNHVYELGLAVGTTSWQLEDLTQLTSAVAAASDPAPYVRHDSWSTVIYRGTDNHVYELGLAPNSGTWQVGDLTLITGAPLAANTPSGYIRADGVSAINYTTSDNHIHELSFRGVNWETTDLTALAGGP